MFTWSQAWFAPTRDKIDDGLFKFYGYFKGKDFETKYETVDKEKKEEEQSREEQNRSEERKTLDEMHEEIRKGIEYHSNLRSLSFQYVKDGMSKANVKALLRCIMNSSTDSGSKRWTERYDDIDRMVDGVDSAEEFDLGIEEDVSIIDSPIPSPPGLFGKFVQESQEMMRYENEDKLSFVSATFCLASICGRKFNVDIESLAEISDSEDSIDPTALNVYLTLIAPTGYGKDQIKMIKEKVVRQCSGITDGPREFFFSGKDSSLASLYRKYNVTRSMGFLHGEAGVSGQSKLGDRAGLKDFWLNIYGQGHYGGSADAVGRSKTDDEMQQIPQVALTRLGESTDVELAKAYQMDDVMENGVVTRESVFRIVSPAMNKNKNRRTKYSNDILARLTSLTILCRKDVGSDRPETYFLYSDNNKMVEKAEDIQFHYREKQFNQELPIEVRAMCSRMYVKGLRYAALACVFNNKEEREPLRITWPEFEWGFAMAEYEEDTLLSTFKGMTGVNSMDLALNDVYRWIVLLLNGASKNKRATLSQNHIDHKFILNSKLKEGLKNSADVRAIDGDAKHGKYSSGYDKCIDEMVKQQWVRKGCAPGGKGAGIYILKSIQEMVKNL